MTTRDDLHRLVDQLPAEGLETVAEALRHSASLLRCIGMNPMLVGFAPPEPPYPRSVGILTEAPTDLSANVDDYLAGGFGQ
ncbi:hypothetical protein [Streptomyces aureus]|uniref:hypothetical protein n=1 Tax=Streptomyces aureus TaxID=193461 RepID=UPI0036C57153